MKKLVGVTALILLLSSCHTSKQALPAAPVEVSHTDSVRIEYIETVRLDTIEIEVLVPAESVRQVVADSVSRIETSLAVSEAWINADGTLGHSLRHKERSLPASVPVTAKDIKVIRDASTTSDVPVPYPEPVYVKRELGWWDRFRLKSFWIVFGISLISVGWLFRKQIFAIIKKCLKIC